MKKSNKKIAFVVVRYGIDINGGAESHCRMLAERLAAEYDTEVLTTCVKDYTKGGNYYEPGISVINGVRVRRFPVKPYNPEKENVFLRRARRPRSLRKRLNKYKLLPFISKFVPIWQWGLKDDISALRNSVFYSEEMIAFISGHKDDYAALIVLTADFAPFYFTAMTAGEKMIAIPTLHDASVSYRSSLTQAFPHIKYVGFNTDTEQSLGKNMFGAGLKANGIISVGIETCEPAQWEDTKKKFSLPEKYACFVGRVCMEKVGKLSFYYDIYRQKYGKDAIPLVMVGGYAGDVKLPDGVIWTGFVSDEEKRAIMMHSDVLINPSRFESLSLVLLEALNDNVPVLVNGHCKVLKDHCKKSGGAIKYYTNRRNFCRMLNKIVSDEPMRQKMKEKGRKYFEENWVWDMIMDRLRRAIEFVEKG